MSSLSRCELDPLTRYSPAHLCRRLSRDSRLLSDMWTSGSRTRRRRLSMQRSRPTLWLCVRNEVSLFTFLPILPSPCACYFPPPPPSPLLFIYWFDCRETMLLRCLSFFLIALPHCIRPNNKNHWRFLILLLGFSRSPSIPMIPAAFSLLLFFPPSYVRLFKTKTHPAHPPRLCN